MKTLYLDCVGGISGDMLVAALLDLDPSLLPRLEGELKRLPLPKPWQMTFEPCRKGDFEAKQVRFEFPEERAHRHLSDILEIIAGGNFATAQQEKIEQTFRILAEAESATHGIDLEEVHFHEVGAVDTILDIVAVVLLLDYLAIDTIVCSPLPLGRGFTEGSHGTMPLPAPAVFQMLPGAATYGIDVAAETVTPTGLALLKSHQARFGAMPPLHCDSIGLGAGKRDFDFPNLLRAVMGHDENSAEDVFVLEATIDDMTGEHLGYLWQRLFQAGALDLYFTPIQMKKGRPGQKVTLLSTAEYYEALRDILFEETSTFGMICRREYRFTLDRDFKKVDTPFGPVTFKYGRGFGVEKVAPEYEELVTIAEKHRLPLAHVYEVVCRAQAMERK